jgi:hypothetical protein
MRNKWFVTTAVLLSLVALLLVLGVAISIEHTRSFLIAEEHSLHIDGTEVYKKVTFGGCHTYQVGESSHLRCEYRLDVFYRGSGNYQADYQHLVSGLAADGYSGQGGIGGATPTGVNGLLGIDTWAKQGMNASQSLTLIATPFFQGQGITRPTFQGYYISPTAPSAAMTGNHYVYGITIRKSFIDIPNPL